MASNLLRGSVRASVTTRGKIQVTHYRDNDEILPSNIVDSQFPEFIREEYPKIVDFAKAYYNYISGNTGIGNIYDMRDLDETTGQFIESLKKEYAYNTPRFSFLNDVEFIRAASKFYSSKGSEESYKFLFRIMFNDEVDIMYPSEQIFKPSTAKWVQQQSVKVSLLNGSVPATDFIGDFLTVRNAANESQLILVEDAVSISEFDNEFEILFETELVIDVNVDDVLVGENFLAKIIPTLETAVPLIPGQKFKVGQVIRFTTTTGSGGVGVVTVVDNNSGIKHIKMLQFGTAYLTNFYLSVVPDGVFTETTGSYVAGSGPTAADIYTVAQDATEGYLEEGDILRTDYVLNDSPGAYPNYAEPGYHGTYVSEFNIRQVFVLDDDYSALLLCKVGAVAKYPGKHVDMTGFPSNASVLQDNNYYQDFSYVVKNKRNIKEYRDVMTNMVHPSGMKMFGEKSENLVFGTTSSLMASTVAATNDLNYNFRASATASVEHYSMMLDFTRTSTLDSKITFSRTGTAASYYDETSVVKAEENLLTYSQEFDNAIWAKSNATVTANTTTAPDGTSTADSIFETSATSGHYISQGCQVVAGTYTISFFAKKGSGASARDFVQLVLTTTPFGANSYVNFNIALGTVTATGSVSSASITGVGNGWYRCVVIDTAASAVGAAFYIAGLTSGTSGSLESYAGNTAADIYIWGAQLEQRSTVTAYTPTTTQAITNYIRPLQYAAANVARIDYDPTVISQQNLLTYSEQFDNAAWIKSAQTITANLVTAPDGTLNAEKLIATAVNTLHYVYRQPTFTAGQSYSWSIYAKAGEASLISLWYSATGGAFSSSQGASFDLTNGVVYGTTGSVFPTITSVGNGWYRISIIMTATATATGTFGFGSHNPSNLGGYIGGFLGDGVSGVYIWGAQLNTGATDLPYLQTTTAAKTLYAPKGLLIEEQRTNLLTYSEQFDNGVWIKSGSALSTNTVVAPDGTQTGDTIVGNSATSLKRIYTSVSKTASSVTYTSSIYARAGEWVVLHYQMDDGSASNMVTGYFDLSTGSATSNNTGTFTGSATTVNVGNGWLRCIVTYTTNTTTTTRVNYFASNSTSTPVVTGNDYSGIYIWGAQLEAGAFPTSYIPTVASQVTRGADVANMSGTNFSSWYNQTAGTWVTEFQGGRESTQGFYGRVIGYGSSATILSTNGATNILSTWDGTVGVNITVSGADYFVTGGKAAAAYDSSGRTITGNGTTPASGANNFPTISSISIGSNASSTNVLNGHIKKIVYYPSRLSNARLQALTT